MNDLKKYEEWCKDNRLNPMEPTSMALYAERHKDKNSKTVKFKDIVSHLLDKDIPEVLKEEVGEAVEGIIKSANEAREVVELVKELFNKE